MAHPATIQPQQASQPVQGWVNDPIQSVSGMLPPQKQNTWDILTPMEEMCAQKD